MVDNRSRYYAETEDKTNAVVWDKWREQTPGESERQRGFIVEGRAKGLRGYALWSYCDDREMATGPHTEYAPANDDRSQLSPYGRDDPRWWPHTQDERDEQVARMGALLEDVGIVLSSDDRARKVARDRIAARAAATDRVKDAVGDYTARLNRERDA